MPVLGAASEWCWEENPKLGPGGTGAQLRPVVSVQIKQFVCKRILVHHFDCSSGGGGERRTSRGTGFPLGWQDKFPAWQGVLQHHDPARRSSTHPGQRPVCAEWHARPERRPEDRRTPAPGTPGRRCPPGAPISPRGPPSTCVAPKAPAIDVSRRDEAPGCFRFG